MRKRSEVCKRPRRSSVRRRERKKARPRWNGAEISDLIALPLCSAQETERLQKLLNKAGEQEAEAERHQSVAFVNLQILLRTEMPTDVVKTKNSAPMNLRARIDASISALQSKYAAEKTAMLAEAKRWQQSICNEHATMAPTTHTLVETKYQRTADRCQTCYQRAKPGTFDDLGLVLWTFDFGNDVCPLKAQSCFVPNGQIYYVPQFPRGELHSERK